MKDNSVPDSNFNPARGSGYDVSYLAVQCGRIRIISPRGRVNSYIRPSALHCPVLAVDFYSTSYFSSIMSELESQFVLRGPWTDLAQGSIMGKTITTDTRTGAFVIALLAILSGLAAAHLWHLVAFTIHQVRADGRPKHVLIRQQQAMLRTLPSPGSLIADSMKLMWTWGPKHRAPQVVAQTLMLVALALVAVAITWASSIFSSYVVSTANLHVLVSSPHCGAINLTFDTYTNIGLVYLAEVVTVAEPFAEDCFLNKSQSLPARCEACE